MIMPNINDIKSGGAKNFINPVRNYALAVFFAGKILMINNGFVARIIFKPNLP